MNKQTTAKKPSGQRKSLHGVEDTVVGNGGEFHQVANGSHKPLTNQVGLVVADDENSLKTGERGPVLLEDRTYRPCPRVWSQRLLRIDRIAGRCQ